MKNTTNGVHVCVCSNCFDVFEGSQRAWSFSKMEKPVFCSPECEQDYSFRQEVSCLDAAGDFKGADVVSEIWAAVKAVR